MKSKEKLGDKNLSSTFFFFMRKSFSKGWDLHSRNRSQMFYKRVALKNCPNIVRKAPVLQSKIENKFFSQLSKMFFSMECFLADSLRFFSTNVKIWSAGYSPSDASILRNYLKFPNVLTLKSFGNSCGNSYIHFLVIII